MTDTVSAFGYTVPLVVVLAFIALVIGLAIAVMFWLTISLSVYRSVQATRRDEVRENVQEQLLDGAFDPSFDWDQWVAGLSAVERDVAESLLDEYLRELAGQSAERLRELGEALGIPDRSQKRLAARNEYERLHALTWLTLLQRPDKVHAAEFHPRTLRERATVVRLRYESGALADTNEGLLLLLDGTTTQFTVFGQDTLYRLARRDPDVLFAVAMEHHETWSETLLVQVLTVCRHLGEGVSTDDLSWLTHALEHESVAVREAAALAFSGLKWRDDVGDPAYLDRLVSDPAPRVRGAVYRTLAQWGDEQALAVLGTALRAEESTRTRLVGTDALAQRRGRLGDDKSIERSTAVGDTWAWSSEHAAYDRTARLRRKTVTN